tara:strand:- start:3462 stop:4121 length:660 start_codon:yes stop_codon:yes gene_type:complete
MQKPTKEMLRPAVELYVKQGRFCQADPYNSHLAIIYQLREQFSDNCNYLEIGSLFGFSMIHALLSETSGVFVGVDLFQESGRISISGSAVNDYTSDTESRGLHRDKTADLVDQCNIHEHPVTFIQGNSQLPKIQSTVQSVCKEFDIMFIDGDHSYEGVKSDFHAYEPLLAQGGYLLLDDQDYSTISRFINEIKNNDRYEWIPCSGYDRKFEGYFRKLLK